MPPTARIRTSALTLSSSGMPDCIRSITYFPKIPQKYPSTDPQTTPIAAIGITDGQYCLHFARM